MDEYNSPDTSIVRAAPGQGPFTLSPVIEEAICMGQGNSGSIFLIEDLQRIVLSESGPRHTVQLSLGDGELCVQALLSGSMHHLVDNGHIAPGCYVRVDAFTVNWLPAEDSCKSEDSTDMVYFAVEHLVTIGWNDSYKALWDEQVGNVGAALLSNPDKIATGEVTNHLPRSAPQVESHPDKRQDDVFGPLHRQIPYPFRSPQKEAKQKKSVKFNSRPTTASTEPVALPRDWRDAQTPLKLTTLRGIPNLPYHQNWSCNVLAIVATLSPVEPSYLPPYRQRTARLTDPSTSKQVHLTVFLDPEEFEPKIGSAVLLVGVKNHTFDGGSLKKYASDKERDGGIKWWYQDPLHLQWCNVQGIKDWWAAGEGQP